MSLCAARLKLAAASVIYKICPAALWREAERDGIFRGSADDKRDGFIHFSTAAQLAETAAKHFAGQRDLMLLRVDAAKLGADLKWETSRGGALFPHLYGDLGLDAVMTAQPLQLGPDGLHKFPPLEK
ncbi:MAG TPA: DUF952 domain-containing protein [Pseudolabrys sp.]|nr:DUF952 domain-containing protein [Pseudolabrys sp.]